MDEIACQALAAIAARDWQAVRPLLHPYLHWTGADNRTARGRNEVMAMLEHAAAPAAPSSIELRDGQIYRWRA